MDIPGELPETGAAVRELAKQKSKISFAGVGSNSNHTEVSGELQHSKLRSVEVGCHGGYSGCSRMR